MIISLLTQKPIAKLAHKIVKDEDVFPTDQQ